MLLYSFRTIDSFYKNLFLKIFFRTTITFQYIRQFLLKLFKFEQLLQSFDKFH